MLDLKRYYVCSRAGTSSIGHCFFSGTLSSQDSALVARFNMSSETYLSYMVLQGEGTAFAIHSETDETSYLIISGGFGITLIKVSKNLTKSYSLFLFQNIILNSNY